MMLPKLIPVQVVAQGFRYQNSRSHYLNLDRVALVRLPVSNMYIKKYMLVISKGFWCGSFEIPVMLPGAFPTLELTQQFIQTKRKGFFFFSLSRLKKNTEQAKSN